VRVEADRGMPKSDFLSVLEKKMKTNEKRIPIKLSGECGVRYGNEPLTFGVPFAEGDFPVGARLRAVTGSLAQVSQG